MESCQKKKIKPTMPNNGSSSSSCSNQHHHHQIEDQQEEEEDRISFLPDTLLITIISLLSINSAAATSALSRRWRHLWTQINHLSLDFAFHRSFGSAITIINHIFSQLKSPKIHSYHLQVSEPPSTFNYSDFLVPWFDHICCRNPEVISVEIIGADYYLCKIPNCLFETQSLVQLHFNVNFKFEPLVHDYNSRMLSFNLPNLKKLALDLYDSNIALIGRNGPLFKACPLLEDLVLSLLCFEDDQIVDISAANLKRLRLHVMAEYLEDFKIVIDAPNLEKFYLQGDLTFFDFIKNPTSLQEAEISIRESFSSNDNAMSMIPGLFQGISCVRSLVINDCGTYILLSINDLDAPPMFHNLMYLSLCCNSNELPRCFLSGNLKRVDVREVFPHYSHDAEMELIKHILSNAMVLEKLRVYVSDNIDSSMDEEQMEFEFCKELFKHPKSSVNCQIDFYGAAINASSKDFIDGVLTYQTLD